MSLGSTCLLFGLRLHIYVIFLWIYLSVSCSSFICDITVLSLSERKILSTLFVHVHLASPQCLCAIHYNPVLRASNKLPYDCGINYLKYKVDYDGF